MSLEKLTNNPYHKGTHDDIVKNVVKRLEETKLYDCIKHNVNYYLKKKRVYGEADVLAIAGNRGFAFEIKSSAKGKNKAYHQLKKDECLLNREGISSVFKFHVFKPCFKCKELYKRIK